MISKALRRQEESEAYLEEKLASVRDRKLDYALRALAACATIRISHSTTKKEGKNGRMHQPLYPMNPHS